MQLEMPQDCVCPLCRNETVELRENKRGNPYFQCRTFASTVNLRPGEGTEEAESVLSECLESEPEEADAVLEQLDGEEEENTEKEQQETAEGQSLNDLLSQGDDDA